MKEKTEFKDFNGLTNLPQGCQYAIWNALKTADSVLSLHFIDKI